jgi:hypothetical protein
MEGKLSVDLRFVEYKQGDTVQDVSLDSLDSHEGECDDFDTE